MQRLLIPVFWWTPLLLGGWTLNGFGTWANPEGTIYPDSQIGVVKNVFVGKLSCAARLLPGSQFQAWCAKGNVIVWNQVNSLTGTAVISADYTDHRPNEPDAVISWVVAYVEGNPKTVGYRVDFTADSADGNPPKTIDGQF